MFSTGGFLPVICCTTTLLILFSFGRLFVFLEMEPRRTRSSFIPLPLRPGVTTRMVKSTCVPSHELAKLKASKPMLVIPQPVLRIHECLDDNVRMAQVESNAYIALGIKEEPIDEEYDAEGRYYEDVNFSTMESFSSERSYAEGNQYKEPELEGVRTTRASKRRRLAGLIENIINKEDDNNNSSKISNKRKPRRGKKSELNQEFRPIVLNVRSLAPGEPESQNSTCSDDVNLQSLLLVQSQKSIPSEAIEGNNNIEKEDITSAKNDEQSKLKKNLKDVPALLENCSPSKISSVKSSIDVVVEKPVVPSKDSTPEPETVSTPALSEDAVNETENDLSLSTVVEEEEESSSEEESEAEDTRKISSVELWYDVNYILTCSQAVGAQRRRKAYLDLQRLSKEVLSHFDINSPQEEAFRHQHLLLYALQ